MSPNDASTVNNDFWEIGTLNIIEYLGLRN